MVNGPTDIEAIWRPNDIQKIYEQGFLLPSKRKDDEEKMLEALSKAKISKEYIDEYRLRRNILDVTQQRAYSIIPFLNAPLSIPEDHISSTLQTANVNEAGIVQVITDIPFVAELVGAIKGYRSKGGWSEFYNQAKQNVDYARQMAYAEVVAKGKEYKEDEIMETLEEIKNKLAEA